KAGRWLLRREGHACPGLCGCGNGSSASQRASGSRDGETGAALHIVRRIDVAGDVVVINREEDVVRAGGKTRDGEAGSLRDARADGERRRGDGCDDWVRRRKRRIAAD